MTRSLLVALTLAILALAPSAAAKGPHAIVEPGPGGIAPGERWLTTLTLVELHGRQLAGTRPRMVLRSGSERVVVRSSGEQGRYELSAVFPRVGRWQYAVVHGKRRFEFPAVVIRRGRERDATAFVAFPTGSPEERQGAGGPIYGDTGPAAGGESLPPAVFMPASRGGEGGDGGRPWWIPAAGLALVGAGTLTVLRLRR
jgi:hypothetical protein